MKRSIVATLTFHFTVGYFLVIGAAIAYFLWFSNDIERQYILNKTDMVISAMDKEAEIQDIELNTLLKSFPDTQVLLIDSADQIIQSSAQDISLPAKLRNGTPGQLVSWKDEPFHFKGITTITTKASTEHFRIIVIRDVTSHNEFLSKSTRRMLVSMGVMFFSLSIIGAFVAWHGLKPLRKFSYETNKVDVSTLSHRLEQQEYPKEMQPSIKVFNQMLKRLENSFDQLSFFAANLAHDLRTPLASMTVRNQCMLQGDRNTAEYQETLACNIEELEFLSKTVTDVLLMAKAESEQLAVNTETVDLYRLSCKLAEYFQLLADEKNVEIIISGQAKLTTDSALLRRIIGNLLSNAVRHADANSEIRITINDRGENIQLSVSNLGEPIPTENRKHLFERNFSRIKNSGVHIGIGLSLSKALLRALNGHIWVESTQDKTEFFISLTKTTVKL